jgi:hypothetical protein
MWAEVKGLIINMKRIAFLLCCIGLLCMTAQMMTSGISDYQENLLVVGVVGWGFVVIGLIIFGADWIKGKSKQTKN